jgi:ribosomal protein L3
LLEGITQVDVTGAAKGKGFQGMVKKFHIKGG